METVKMSSAVQTKALVSPGGTKQVSKAENAGNFVKLLQEKGQTADAGGTQAAASGDSGKNLKADTKEAKTRDEKTEDPLVDDILRQAGAQQAAAQITGILQEIPAVGGEDVIPELGTGGAESVTAGAGVTEIMSEVLGSGDSMPQVRESLDSVVHVEVKAAESPESATEHLTLRPHPDLGEPEAAKRPEQSGNTSDQGSTGKSEAAAPESSGETREPLMSGDPSKNQHSPSKLPEGSKKLETLSGIAQTGDAADRPEIAGPRLWGKELDTGPVQEKADAPTDGLGGRDSNGPKILQGIFQGNDTKPEGEKTGISGSIAQAARQGDQRTEQEGTRHLAYRTDSLQGRSGDMYEVFKTEPARLKSSFDQLPQDLGKTLAARLPGNGREMVIELEPASLGKLTIKLAYEAGRAAVSILATNPRTLELLNSKAAEIASILEEKTGQETVILTQEPHEQEQYQESKHGSSQQEEQDQGQQRKEKPAHQSDSFAQQLRLGLV